MFFHVGSKQDSLPKPTVTILATVFVIASLAGQFLLADPASATLRHNPPVVSEVCNPTTDIGQPYACSWAIQDTDGFEDGITVSALNDTIDSAEGAVDSGNLLSLDTPMNDRRR